MAISDANRQKSRLQTEHFCDDNSYVHTTGKRIQSLSTVVCTYLTSEKLIRS